VTTGAELELDGADDEEELAEVLAELLDWPAVPLPEPAEEQALTRSKAAPPRATRLAARRSRGVAIMKVTP